MTDQDLSDDDMPEDKTIGQVLPEPLVDMIKAHSRCNFLDWEADCEVGDSCIKVGEATKALVELLDKPVIDVEPIWEAAAHQCRIFAYA